MKIFKYLVPVEDRFEVELPFGATVLCVQTQQERPYIWAKVVPGHETEKRAFRVFGTGHTMPGNGLKYIGTFQLHGGGFIGHLFEEER